MCNALNRSGKVFFSDPWGWMSNSNLKRLLDLGHGFKSSPFNLIFFLLLVRNSFILFVFCIYVCLVLLIRSCFRGVQRPLLQMTLTLEVTVSAGLCCELPREIEEIKSCVFPCLNMQDANKDTPGLRPAEMALVVDPDTDE